MAQFIAILAKKYDPYVIDGPFAMNVHSTRCVPIVCTKNIAEDGYGTATVDGVEISKGKCYKFSFSPYPIYLLPVGEVANECNKTYTVKLTGYVAENGKRFATKTFKIRTANKRIRNDAYAEHEKTAKTVADEGLVLLENDGVLPFCADASVALFGDYKNFRISAVGAGAIKPRWTYTIEEAISENNALSVNQESDVALYFISRSSGEGKDNRPCKGFYYLTDEEKHEIETVVKRHKKSVLVLNTGYPVEMSFLQSVGFNAIIWTGFSGQCGTLSLIDILTGAVNPSGKLTDTWTLDYFDSPSAHNFINLNENDPLYDDDSRKLSARIFYEEGLYVGYRYFDTFNKPVAYCFGHGLSYTRFNHNASAKLCGDILKVKIEAQNVGNIKGKQAYLVFVEPPKTDLDKPKRVFAGFEKTNELLPSEQQTLEITIPVKDFASYDNGCFVLEEGEYVVWVGDSLSNAQPCGTFTIEEKIVEHTRRVNLPVDAITPLTIGGKIEGKSTIVKKGECFIKRAQFSPMSATELKQYKGKRIMLDDVKKDASKLDDFVSQFSVRQLIALSVCNGSRWLPWQSGAAGRLKKIDKYGVPELFMSDGNNGVNLNCFTTGFPSSNLVCGTFNKQLAYAVGKEIAEESKEHNIAINLGPGGNLHRNILCGRNAEYYSEDPILAGTMMASQAKGLEENGTHATYKHFCANNIEFERKSAHAIIAERAYRELYLRVFDKALSLYKPSCIMTSYNPVNGIYPTENAELLQQLVRKEWGFDGFFMTDWGAYDTVDPVKAVAAGTSLLTPGSAKYKRILQRAVREGKLTKAILQDNVKRIISVYIKGANK